jgi:hypothetical protein
MSRDILRVCRFTPYRKGHGPSFGLTMWLANTVRDGRSQIGYKLTMRGGSFGDSSQGKARKFGPLTETLFEGEDFVCSPMHAIDSDAAVASLMSFLTLRPGDTDREYFKDYTPLQLGYCAEHAEALACEVSARFGGES